MIYFIQANVGGPVKVGYTSGDPEKRMRALQVGSPLRLRLVAAIEGDEATEQELHELLEDDHLHGEWFVPSPRLHYYLQQHGCEDGLRPLLSVAKAIEADAEAVPA